MVLAPLLLIKLKNGAKRTSNSSFQKKNGNRIYLNLIHWIILTGVTSQVMWNIIKSKQSMIYVEKALKKVDINYVWEVIGAFLGPVYSVEKRGGELIIDEHS